MRVDTADVGAGPVPARTPVTAFVSACNLATHWPSGHRAGTGPAPTSGEGCREATHANARRNRKDILLYPIQLPGERCEGYIYNFYI